AAGPLGHARGEPPIHSRRRRQRDTGADAAKRPTRRLSEAM
ncbi:MAG: hypothetical protein AVDCRST_MAG42-983, partial [uncultured Chthoniobacterales bacterium]